MKCYVCDEELTLSNRSEEHIIINAAGGRLKSKDLICKRCNSDFGKEIDAALASQLNFTANQLMIKRERGEPQPIIGINESTNEKFRTLPDGTLIRNSPKYTETVDEDHISISATVRNEAELKKIAAGIVKKYPQVKIADILKNANHKEAYIDEPISYNLTVGGSDVFRAVCKCAVNYFIYLRGDAQIVKPLLNYIRGEEQKEIVWLHYQENLYELKDDECFHMIHLRGNPRERILYCYVDYFSTYKYLVLLSDSYKGAEIKSTYCFDVLNLNILDKEFSVEYDRATTINFFVNKDTDLFEKTLKTFKRTGSISQKRQQSNHINKINKQAIKAAWSKYPEGTIITEEMIQELTTETMKKLGSFILHQLKQNTSE